MNETNRTLQTVGRLIRERFHKHFGDRYRIDSIVGSSFDRKEREVNYITVYLAPGGPPLDHRETNDFDILLKEELIGHDVSGGDMGMLKKSSVVPSGSTSRRSEALAQLSLP